MYAWILDGHTYRGPLKLVIWAGRLDTRYTPGWPGQPVSSLRRSSSCRTAPPPRRRSAETPRTPCSTGRCSHPPRRSWRTNALPRCLNIYSHLHGEHGHGVHGGDDAGEGEDLDRLEGVGEVVVGGGAVGDGLGRQLAHEVQLQHRDQESTDHKEVEQCALASRG